MEHFDPELLLRQVSELRARGGIADHDDVMRHLEESLGEQYRRLGPLLGSR